MTLDFKFLPASTSDNTPFLVLKRMGATAVTADIPRFFIMGRAVAEETMSALLACAAESRELSCTELRAPIVIGIFTSRRCVRRWSIVVVVTYHFVNVLLTLMCSGQVR